MSFGMITWDHNMEKKQICYMDADSFIVYVETEDNAKDLEIRFDISDYKLRRTLPRGKNQKFIELMKDELAEKQWQSLHIWDQKYAAI